MLGLSDASNVNPILVSLIEDDRQCAAMLTKALTGEPSFRLLACYRTAEEALIDLPQRPPHVALVDLHLPGMGGIECIAELSPKFPDVAFVVLTALPDDESLFRALRSGAVGYMLKTTEVDSVIDAVRLAKAGGSPMSKGIARKVVRHFHEPLPNADSKLDKLSTREREVLESLAGGLRYKEIAEVMQVSEDTVRTYVRRTYQKLQVTSRTEAVVKLLRR